MLKEISITLDYPHRMLNPNNKKHWGVHNRHFKAYKNLCYYQFLSQKQKHAEFFKKITAQEVIKFKIILCYPDKRKRDKDNAISSFKAGQDGIALALGVDDSKFDPTYEIGQSVKHGKILLQFNL